MQIATTHRNADFDALASLMAATLLYPEAVAVLPRAVNPNVRAFLSLHKNLLATRGAGEIDLQQVTRLVVVDVDHWSRLDGMDPLRRRGDLEIILYDHHPGPGDIRATREVREETGAAVTLMVRDLKTLPDGLTPILATQYLAGIYEDTGHLSFPSTRPEDAHAAAWLLEQGADLNVIGSFLRTAYGEKQKEVLFRMLRGGNRQRLNGYNVSINRIQIQGHVEGLAVVVQMYREIMNVDAAFGIFTDRRRGRITVIGRSDSEGLDVGAVMRDLGGGGHGGAGSAQVRNLDSKAVERRIVDYIQGHGPVSVMVGDMMSFPVYTVRPDMPMSGAAVMLREKGCTGVPVVDGEGQLVGVLSRRDFRKVRRESQLDAPVKAFMSSSVTTIGPAGSPQEAARLMVRHDIGRLPVVKDGRLIGIVTRTDAMAHFYSRLPAE